MEKGARVAVADYGAGNIRSLCSGLNRAGADRVQVLRGDAAAVLEAPLAVIAGVGNMSSAARALESSGLADALRERAARGRPVLGICVGMQLLFEDSEEGGSGLGLFAGPVRRLRAPHVPHMGWNELTVSSHSEILRGLDGSDMYFAHSFVCAPSELVTVATTDHGGSVIAAVERGSVAGVQFHPERSGCAGARVLENTLRWSKSV
jgi:imidazole glycerol phosphate synthase glutamine amidotransferase subunit